MSSSKGIFTISLCLLLASWPGLTSIFPSDIPPLFALNEITYFYQIAKVNDTYYLVRQSVYKEISKSTTDFTAFGGDVTRIKSARFDLDTYSYQPVRLKGYMSSGGYILTSATTN